MRERIDEKVSVVSFYSHKKGSFSPYLIYWQNKDYMVGELGITHTYKHGDSWHHIFEVVDKEKTLTFRLNFDTKELTWTLEVVSDGLTA
jgi:hypothetical protein